MIRKLSMREDGTIDAAVRLAADRVLLDAAGRGKASLHFYRFRPAASIGRHQWPETEVRLDWCRTQGIAVVRRLTGGGALYVDEDQLAFTLALPRSVAGDGGLTALLARGATAIARGLARIGIAAAVKPPNDIEVDGHKLASVFAARTERACLVQGTVLLDIDVGRMLRALRVPTEKLSPDGLAGARRRLATLGDVLGRRPCAERLRSALVAGVVEAFGPLAIAADSSGARCAVSSAPDDLTPAPVTATHPPYEAFWPCGGGTLRARLWFGPDGRTIARAALAADAFIDPPELFDRLVDALPGTPLAALRARLARFFAAEPAELVGFGPADIARVLALAAERPAQTRAFALAPAEANALMVCGAMDLGPREIAARATVMLVPYCAKLADCKWRQRDGCAACGLCEVGDAYRIARARGLRAISINNYEHLCATLARLKAERVPAYIGMCCSQFYQKRHRAFRDAGIPALLMNIAGANCYDLFQEEQAYAGTFAAKSTLDLVLLRKVLGVETDRRRPPSPPCRHRRNDGPSRRRRGPASGNAPSRSS